MNDMLMKNHLPYNRNTTRRARIKRLHADRSTALDQCGRRVAGLCTRCRCRRRRMNGVQKLERTAAAAVADALAVRGQRLAAEQKRRRMLGTEVLMLVVMLSTGAAATERHHCLRHVRAAGQQTVRMWMDQRRRGYRCGQQSHRGRRRRRWRRRMDHHITGLHDKVLGWARHSATVAAGRLMMMGMVQLMRLLGVRFAAAAGRRDDGRNVAADGGAEHRKGIVILGDRHAGQPFDVAQYLRIVMGDLGELRLVGAIEVGDADQMLIAGHDVQSGRRGGHLHGTPLHLFDRIGFMWVRGECSNEA